VDVRVARSFQASIVRSAEAFALRFRATALTASIATPRVTENA
jgi:hypothetical protein